MGSAVPTEFGDVFLDWFQERTEAAWSTCPTPTVEAFTQRRMLGCDWQPGTRWLGGLTEGQLAAVEEAWALRFPPDYRLFLRRLHAVDRPLRCTAWGASPVNAGPPMLPTATLPSTPTLRDEPAFFNWLTDADILQRRLDALVRGRAFDVEKNDLWRPHWKARPATAEARAQRVHELVKEAPRLIPVFRHRYLLAEPCQAGNPVFSIVQSDIIVYGADLRTYFLAEFADLLDIDRDETRKEVDDAIQARFSTYAGIPFWGDLLAGWFGAS